MKYTKRIFCLSILALAAGALSLSAQDFSNSYVASSTSAISSHSDDSESVLTIRKRVDEVNVLFIATDKHGKFVRNLTQNDFHFLDDHKPVQSIVNFRRETDLPLKQIALLTGFEHVEYMNVSFKRTVGQTPGRYRRFE